jgi:hypothetical protein
MVNIHFFVIYISIMWRKARINFLVSLTILSNGQNYFMISIACCTNAQLKLRRQFDNPLYLHKDIPDFQLYFLILRYFLWLQKNSIKLQKKIFILSSSNWLRNLIFKLVASLCVNKYVSLKRKIKCRSKEYTAEIL